MVKVCFIISGLGYSGAEIVLERYLENNDFIDPYFIIIYRNDKLINNYKMKYKSVFSIDEKLNFINTKIKLNICINNYINFISRKIENIIKDIDPQIIYSNNTIESMLISKLVYKNNIPSIAHVHDMKESFRGFYKKIVIYESLKKYDKLITVSKATKKSWGNLNFDVIYNGIDEKYFEDYKKEYSRIKKIGFVGGLNKRKGIDIFIRNLNKIVKNNYEVTIVTTDLNSKYYNILKNNKTITILNNLNQNEIKKFMREIDILIVPSRVDPLPTVIMEAMAVGTIVIGSNIESIREMIEDDILIYNGNLCDKIEEISRMNKVQLNKLSIELKRRSIKKFNDNNKKNSVNNIIKSLLAI